MKLLTREWVEKAEEGYRVARRERQAKPPAYSAVCFHAQQCVEKYLKALLQEHESAFSRTHDLCGGGLVSKSDYTRLAPSCVTLSEAKGLKG